MSRRAMALAAALAVTACSTVTDTYQRVMGGNTGPRPAPLSEFKATVPVRVVWRAAIGAAGSNVLTPAYDDGAAYVAGADGRLARLDAETGREVWRIDTGARLSGGVGAGANLVLVGTPKGEVLAFDKQGKAAWKAQVTSEVLSAPQVADGTVVVRSGDSRIFGLDAADGKRKWVYQRATPALTVRSHAGVVLYRGAVFAGFPGGKLVALALGTGAVGWEAAVAQPKGATELERVTDVTSLPVVDERQVCAVAFQGRVACFETASGSAIWARDLSSNAGLGSDRRTIYVSDDQGAVLAFDRGRGSSLWKQDKLSARRPSAPHADGGYVAVGDYQGYVHVLNAEDGAFAARVATDGSAVLAPPVAAGSRFIVQTMNGGVFAIALR
ncbi:MAG: outer membrane protein assembly factor BamB [Betaproteobacteria bacterium]|nr:outer membrane protein assembly factor BamB [Betaproteobacteria bacterium]